MICVSIVYMPKNIFLGIWQLTTEKRIIFWYAPIFSQWKKFSKWIKCTTEFQCLVCIQQLFFHIKRIRYWIVFIVTMKYRCSNTLILCTFFRTLISKHILMALILLFLIYNIWSSFRCFTVIIFSSLEPLIFQ